MRKNPLFAIALVALVAVAPSAFAQKKKPAAKVPATIHCAVMSKDLVNIKEATKNKMYADYKGRRYFFCCAGCPESFKKDPAKYAKSESIKTPKKG